MNEKEYKLFLDGNYIGYTHLENSDAPMGIVYGLMYFEDIESPYDFFTHYCKENNLAVNYNEPDVKLIDTQVLDGLKVMNVRASP